METLTMLSVCWYRGQYGLQVQSLLDASDQIPTQIEVQLLAKRVAMAVAKRFKVRRVLYTKGRSECLSSTNRKKALKSVKGFNPKISPLRQ